MAGPLSGLGQSFYLSLFQAEKNALRFVGKLLKSRSAMGLGHLKNAHRFGQNYLLGKIGDKINAMLSTAFNLKK